MSGGRLANHRGKPRGQECRRHGGGWPSRRPIAELTGRGFDGAVIRYYIRCQSRYREQYLTGCHDGQCAGEGDQATGDGGGG